MRLGELRGLIRKTKGNPIITLAAPPGAADSWKLAVQKTPLLEELERVFPGGKATETGLEFNAETGVLWCPAFDETTGMPMEGAVPASKVSIADIAAAKITANKIVIDDDLDLDLDDDDIDLGDDDVELDLDD